MLGQCAECESPVRMTTVDRNKEGRNECNKEI